MSIDIKKQNWILEQHRKCNHYYDEYLPYEFHLRMVTTVFEQFKHLLDDKEDYYGNSWNGREYSKVTLRDACEIACWGHDLIEDTLVNYNAVKDKLGPEAADIIYAVTNEKGRNRKERANAKYYEGIRNTKGAIFVKLCDRIANVQYSKLTKSRMFDVYKDENYDFLIQLGVFDDLQYTDMVVYLKNLFI